MRRLLEQDDPADLERWAAEDRRAPRVLQALLFDPDDLVRWRAVEAMGAAAAGLARGGAEAVRELVRRTLWLMNDESGGVLWNGPEVIGATLARVPPLCVELGRVLHGWLDEEPFRAGTRWALWRIADVHRPVVAEAATLIVTSLADPDPAVRGHAALALSAVRAPELAAVAADATSFTLYDFRRRALRTVSVAEAALGAP